VALRKPVPVITTEGVVEVAKPNAGATPVTVGVVSYVKAPVAVNEPLGVVRTMSATPTVPFGVVTIIEPPLFVPKVAVAPRKLTSVAPVKFAPLIVTDVPPPTGP
jgi:hypothetical protein